MWDVFISHASEDKEAIAEPLANALSAAGFKVWYDDLTLRLGDSLHRSINRGLAESRYGIVILSPAFLAKEWPQRELDGLTAREVSSGKVILPVWHNVSRADIERYSPILADRLAVSTDQGLDVVVDEIRQVLTGKTPATLRPEKAKQFQWKTLGIVASLLIAVFMAAGILFLDQTPRPQEARAELGRLSLAYTPEAFIETAANGDVHAVGLYLTAGMDPDVRGERGYTALMHAIGRDHVPVVEALLAAGADVNTENHGGATALDWAVSYGNVPVLRRLLESGARHKAINTAFLTAAQHGQLEMLKTLVDAGADAGRLANEALLATTGTTVTGVRDDAWAAMVETLLSLGADLSVKNENGWMPLHLATNRGFTQAVQTLLKAGAAVNARCECRGFLDGGWTALLLAARGQRPEILRILLDRGADVSAQENRGRTALMLAAEDGDADMIRMLLAAGAPRDTTDQEGNTALALARRRHRPEIEQLLQQRM